MFSQPAFADISEDDFCKHVVYLILDVIVLMKQYFGVGEVYEVLGIISVVCNIGRSGRHTKTNICFLHREMLFTPVLMFICIMLKSTRPVKCMWCYHTVEWIQKLVDKCIERYAFAHTCTHTHCHTHTQIGNLL